MPFGTWDRVLLITIRGSMALFPTTVTYQSTVIALGEASLGPSSRLLIITCRISAVTAGLPVRVGVWTLIESMVGKNINAFGTSWDTGWFP